MKKLLYLSGIAMLLSGCKTFDSQMYLNNPETAVIFRSASPVPYFPIGVADLSPITILFAVVSIIIGLLVFAEASSVIKAQIKFYKKINWRIAPVSMKKEIRNTKIIGLFLFVIGVVTIIYIKFFLK